MKTLSSENDIAHFLKKTLSETNKIADFRFQELYDYLNQFKYKEGQILMSIILPAYNEEKTIKQLLENLPNNKSIEIIVIDDNSTDNSAKEIRKVNNRREIKLIKHKKNRGYGGAVLTGIKNARGDVIVTMDSDGQHSPADIIQLIKPIFEGEVDCTIGSRYLGNNYYNLPILTRLGEAILEKLLQICFGQRVMNSQNGFRAFKRNLVSVLEKARFYGFTYATEMVILILINGHKIKECPIKVYQREYGSSKINLAILTLDILSCFLKYYIKKIVWTIKRRN